MKDGVDAMDGFAALRGGRASEQGTPAGCVGAFAHANELAAKVCESRFSSGEGRRIAGRIGPITALLQAQVLCMAVVQGDPSPGGLQPQVDLVQTVWQQLGHC